MKKLIFDINVGVSYQLININVVVEGLKDRECLIVELIRDNEWSSPEGKRNVGVVQVWQHLVDIRSKVNVIFYFSSADGPVQPDVSVQQGRSSSIGSQVKNLK